MFAFKDLVPDPVFERDGRLHVRVSDRSTVPLQHADRAPVTRFSGEWKPTSLHTGLGCLYFLTLEQAGAKVSWILSPDGRRLGDKLADLPASQQQLLRDAAAARGLGSAEGLIGNAIHFIDPALLREILAAVGPSGHGRDMTVLPAAQTALTMLSAPHRLQTHLHYVAGSTSLRLGEGWSTAPEAPARAVGRLSLAQGAAMPAASRYLLGLTLTPMAASGGRSTEIGIAVNDRALADLRLDPHWQEEGAEFAFWLPPETVAERPFEIAFRHDQDFLLTSLQVQCGGEGGERGLDPREVMQRFENLGDNCEFGLVQRHFGAEPVGLLRFAGLRNPRRLIRFLEDDFGSFGEPGSLDAVLIGGEYWIIDRTYGIAYHTFRYPNEIDAASVIRENEVKAMYLKRKFREDLEDGEKILVYKRVVTRNPHELLALHAALNRFGTVNRLFWVTQADTDHAAGEVEWVGDRLLKGYVGRISLEDARDFDADTWLRLCRNALTAFAGLSPA